MANQFGVFGPTDDVVVGNLPPLNKPVTDAFASLLQWMGANGWLGLVKTISGIDLNGSGPMNPALFTKFKPNIAGVPGCDDFAGCRLIQPGFPGFSLLYHLLASPFVTITTNEYPSLEQLDALENFIYGLQLIDADTVTDDNMVLAVFAYEYRPACKTPHDRYADMVFSRSGFGRVGSQPMDYDKKNRCFSNQPATGPEAEIAVSPARYGLFLAQRMNYDQLSIFTPVNLDENMTYDFLLPIKKVFKDDIYLQGNDISFCESHINEKLSRLCTIDGVNLPPKVKFDKGAAPFIRRSSSSTDPQKKYTAGIYDPAMVSLTTQGSSVLVASVPSVLVRRAFQQVGGKPERLRVLIPEIKESNFVIPYSNRRYTSFKSLNKKAQTQDALDIAAAKLLHPDKILTDYDAPRNTPMFMNIREMVSENDGDKITHLTEIMDGLEAQTGKSYWVGLFEDSICDGCVNAELSGTAAVVAAPTLGISDAGNKILRLKILPAFSVITAPDFFPYIDSYDLHDYKDLFLLGGIEDMSGARKRANPDITLPGTTIQAFTANGPKDHAQEEQQKPLFAVALTMPSLETKVEETILAMVSPLPEVPHMGDLNMKNAQTDALARANYLPDSATKIFYPGWDVTFSGGVNAQGVDQGTFYATFGLGSPFVEDSKLCAAVNGMWVGTSPDAARTYRASLTSVQTGVFKSEKPPTALPLLDNELGYNALSPAVADYGLKETTGWDGEQGPCLKAGAGTVIVNFTDIARADYVQSALKGEFDMSQLRKITTAEMKFRMSCLSRSYKALGLPTTALWMVGAEKVADWAKGANGYCIPKDMVAGGNGWITQSKLAKGGEGYLYVFAKMDESIVNPMPNSKRALQKCTDVYAFQLTADELKCCKLSASNNWAPQWM